MDLFMGYSDYIKGGKNQRQEAQLLENSDQEGQKNHESHEKLLKQGTGYVGQKGD